MTLLIQVDREKRVEIYWVGKNIKRGKDTLHQIITLLGDRENESKKRERYCTQSNGTHKREIEKEREIKEDERKRKKNMKLKGYHRGSYTLHQIMTPLIKIERKESADIMS